MDSADENEATSGGGLQRGAEGARLRLELGMEGVRGQAGTEPAGGGEAGDGLTGTAKVGDREKGSGRTAEEMRVDLTVVKEEVMDWSEMEEGMPCGQRIKQEVEEEKPDSLEVRQEVGSGLVVKEETVDEPEVMDGTAKVKEEGTDWREVKEERKGNLEVKQMFFGQTIKKEMMDEVCVKKEKHFPKTEMLDDTKVKEGPQINSPVGSKRKLAMSRCETCGTEEAKYRCPRCMRYSCSLPCVKKHKVELTCNGVRDKTAYISLQQFTEMDLLSDYRFLEDVARTADHISRDVLLKKPLSNKHMYFMKNRARRQGINLKLLPNGFTKRKENSTFFDKKKQQFCWHVKLQFPQSQAVYIEKRVPDDKTINEILRPYIDPEKSDPVIRQRLKAYTHSQTGVQILMKVENMQQNSVRYQLNHGHLIYLISQIIKLLYPKLRKVARIILVQLLTTNGFFIFDLLQCACSEEGKDAVTDVRLGILGMGVVHMNIIRHRGDGEDQLENFCTHRYYELDPHKSLLDNLKNKVIIEYPTLHVVLKESNKDMKVLHQGVHMKVRLPVTKQKEKATFVEYLEPSEK